MSEGLYESSERQIEQHGIEATRAVLLNDGRGDGWITNDWRNQHLSGSLVQMRKRSTIYGRRYQIELVPIDSVMRQVDLVGQSIDNELVQLAGTSSVAGEMKDGEIMGVAGSRLWLRNWLTLEADEKQTLKDFYGQAADRRRHATNPLNMLAGDRFSRIRNLKDSTGRDNPQAVLVQTRPLEADLVERHDEVSRTKIVNSGRQIRLQKWFRDENRQLATAQEAIDGVLKSQNESDLDWLARVASHIRFYIQPFNYVAMEVGGVKGNIRQLEVVDPIERLREGLFFIRARSHLAEPFRRIVALKKDNFGTAAVHDELRADVGQRMATLEEMSLHGAYNTTRGRVLDIGNQVISAIDANRFTDTKKMSNTAKSLLMYFCLPKDDPETTTWYQYHL
ncbi:MAG TPA: hypothetical protein VLG25_02265 [Patescibacteria group bacterium]|nr:hypothetical protein [Patescibacteria group bacterium]